MTRTAAPPIALALDAGTYLGETPVWSAREQALYWINCEHEPMLSRWDPASGATGRCPNASAASCSRKRAARSSCWRAGCTTAISPRARCRRASPRRCPSISRSTRCSATAGTGGVDGITTISYTFEPAGDGLTLFTRTLHCELPRGVRIPDQLLIARAQPAGIDAYHDAVARELDQAKAERT